MIVVPNEMIVMPFEMIVAPFDFFPRNNASKKSSEQLDFISYFFDQQDTSLPLEDMPGGQTMVEQQDTSLSLDRGYGSMEIDPPTAQQDGWFDDNIGFVLKTDQQQDTSVSLDSGSGPSPQQDGWFDDNIGFVLKIDQQQPDATSSTVAQQNPCIGCENCQQKSNYGPIYSPILTADQELTLKQIENIAPYVFSAIRESQSQIDQSQLHGEEDYYDAQDEEPEEYHDAHQEHAMEEAEPTYDKAELRAFSVEKNAVILVSNLFKFNPLDAYIEMVETCEEFLNEYENETKITRGGARETYDPNTNKLTKFLEKVNKRCEEKGITFYRATAVSGQPGRYTLKPMEFICKGKEEKPTGHDKKSIRFRLQETLLKMKSRKGTIQKLSLAKELRRQRIESLAEEVENAPTSLRDDPEYTPPPTSDTYVPHYEDPDAPAEVTDEEYEQYQRNVAEAEAAAGSNSCDSSSSNDAADQPQPNAHVTFLSVLLQYCYVFNCFMAMEASNLACTFEELLQIIILTGFELEDLTHMNGWSGYEERWKNEWKWMLGSITFALIRRLCLQCYRCHRKPGDRSRLFGWHLDHLLLFWTKVDSVSKFVLNGRIYEMILEALKTRLVCAFCHEQGRIKNYAEHLQYENKFQYYFGMSHRDIRAVLKLKEVRAFILDLRSRGAFSRQIPFSWRTFEVVSWFHLGIYLPDLTYKTEADFYAAMNTGFSYLTAMTMVQNVLRKLSVRCPNDLCLEFFDNLIPAEMSGVHMNHRLEKMMSPSDALKKGIDFFLDEVDKRGNCNCICASDHGVLNDNQRGWRNDSEEWVQSSMGVVIIR